MAKNTRKKNSRRPIDTISQARQSDRLTELEQRIAELEKDVAILKMSSSLPLFTYTSDEAEEKKRPGPKGKIRENALLHCRDDLVLWLEQYWSWLELRVPKTRNGDEARALIEAICEPSESRPWWQTRFLQNTTALHQFLMSERFRKTPLGRATLVDALNTDMATERRQRAANQFPSRQIANAMAGVPEIGWRTSLDRCSAQPSYHYVVGNLEIWYRLNYRLPLPRNRSFEHVNSPLPRPQSKK